MSEPDRTLQGIGWATGGVLTASLLLTLPKWAASDLHAVQIGEVTDDGRVRCGCLCRIWFTRACYSGHGGHESHEKHMKYTVMHVSSHDKTDESDLWSNNV